MALRDSDVSLQLHRFLRANGVGQIEPVLSPSKDPANRKKMAEIPCYRELTGNLHFFERGQSRGLACGAAEFGGFREKSRL
jgi:hypothetical protein